MPRHLRAASGGPILLSAVALAATAAHADVAQGPMLQAVTSDQAAIWVRTSIDQPVRVQLSGPEGVTITPAVTTSLEESDDTAHFLLTGLVPGTTYTYQLGLTDSLDGNETWTGSYTFRTVPDDVASMNIAVLADFKNKLAPSTALQAALGARPDLLAIIGDLDHRDPADVPGGGFYPPEDAPTVLADMRRMHRDTRDPSTAIGANFAAGLVGTPDSGVPQIPMAYVWDDHDFCSNNVGADCPFAAQAFQALSEYFVQSPDNSFAYGCEAPSGFQSLTFGQLVQVFLLDARSNRDSANPDGDTAMLGACQHDWLVEGVRNSQATWKLVLSPVTLNATMKTWDSWSHFANERASLIDALSGVPGIVVVSGDVHTGGAIDDGTHSGLPEVATPHAGMPKTFVNTYCRVQDGTVVSRPGSWTIGGSVDPITGVKPLSCLNQTFPDGTPVDGLAASIYPLDGRNNPGYVWIAATPDSLTLTVRNAHGKVKKGVRADLHRAPLQLQLQAPAD